MSHFTRALAMLSTLSLLVAFAHLTAFGATVQIAPRAQGQVYFPDEPVEIGLIVMHDGLFHKVEHVLHYTVQNFWGETLLQGEAPLRSKTASEVEAHLQIELPHDARGWFHVALTLSTAEGIVPLRNPATAEGSSFVTFAVVDPPQVGPRPDSFFGMGEHHLDARNAELMRRAGIRRLRTDVLWQSIQTAKDGPIDWRRLDAIFATADAYGIAILPIIDYTARFAAQELPGVQPGNPVHYPPDEEAWRSFVRALVERYQGVVPVWEVWNEPNAHFWLGTPAQYADLLRQAYEEIRVADPSASVAIGGTSGTPLHWFRDVAAAGAAPHFDIVAVHPYRQPREPELSMLADLQRIVDWAEDLPPSLAGVQNRPLWITEMGYHTLGNERAVSEQEQAEYMVRAMTKALAFGVEAFYWYEFADGAVDFAHSEANFGLTHHNLMPKPAYVAYTVMERQLGEAQTGRRIDLADQSLRAYAFRSGGAEELIVAWSLAGEAHVHWPAEDVITVTDVMGELQRPATVTTADGASVAIRLSSSPVYITGLQAAHLEADASVTEVASEPMPNLVSNGSFETGFRPPLGWSFQVNEGARFTWERRSDEDGAPDGETYLRLQNVSPRSPHVYGRVYQTIRVQPWTTYLLTAQVRTARNPGSWIGGGTGWATRFDLPEDTHGEWVQFQAEFTTTDGPTWELMILLEDVIEYVDIDDVRVTQKVGP